MPAIGKKAPAFTLQNQDGDKVKLSDFKGRTVVLFAYPKAATPGCTTQACGFRDVYADITNLGAVVLGCGALGSVAADMLARAGVGRLVIIDRDFIEPTNLQRQVLYDEQDIAYGRPKAEAARRNGQRAPCGRESVRFAGRQIGDADLR